MKKIEKASFFQIHHILSLLSLVAIFLLASNKIHDTDAWMHLSLGRLIFDLKSLPENELFFFSSSNIPFFYSSWLFAVLCYLSYLLFNVAGLLFLKAFCVTATFFFLFKDILRPHKNYLIAILGLIGVFLLAEYRFVLRPEIFMMIFLAFTIFSLNAYYYDKKKYVYVLPFISLIWANSHSSIILIFVPFSAFLIGGLIQHYLGGKLQSIQLVPTIRQIKIVALFFILSFFASLLNPNFHEQYLYGSDLLQADWYKQQIEELWPPKGIDLIILIALNIFIAASFILARKRLSFINLLLVLPFMVVPFTATRFQILLALVGIPILVKNISIFIDEKKWPHLENHKPLAVILSAVILTYTFFALSGSNLPGAGKKEYGIGFDFSKMPKGAVYYMNHRNIYGKVLNSFSFGQYIIWDSYPQRTVFIDGRGYLSKELLEKSSIFIFSKTIWDNLYAKHGFESVLIRYPEQTAITAELGSKLDFSLTHPDWALVYWDDVSLLYLHRGGEFNHIIQEDEYKYINPRVSFDYFSNNLRNKNNISAELDRNINETDSSLAKVYAGLLSNSLGNYHEARDYLSKVKEKMGGGRNLASIKFHALGDIYSASGDIKKSLASYEEVLKISNDPYVLTKMGNLLLKKGAPDKALLYSSEALQIKSDILPAYALRIKAYKALGKTNMAQEAQKKYNNLKAPALGKEFFFNGLKAYNEKNYPLAIMEFKKSLGVNPNVPVVHTNLGFVYYDLNQLSTAFEYFRKALQLDPNWPNAHYGIALVYKGQEDDEMMKKHLKSYIELEPKGYFTRTAKQEMNKLAK